VTREVVERCRREEEIGMGRARRGPRVDIVAGRIMVRFEGMSARCTTVQRRCTALRGARVSKMDGQETQRCSDDGKRFREHPKARAIIKRSNPYVSRGGDDVTTRCT
jgi:hypothetical protein